MKYGCSIWKTVILAIIIVGLVGCAGRVDTSKMGPDAHFEYAKQLFDKEKYYDALTEFTILVLKYAGNPVIDDAQYFLAETQFKMKEYLVAAVEYQKLVDSYPESPYVVLAEFKIGLCYYKLSLRPELDQEYTYKAIRRFQQFIEEHPNHELRKEAQRLIDELHVKLARKKLFAADIYRKMGRWTAAKIYYQIVLDEFFDTPVAAEALYWKGEAEFVLEEYEHALATLTAYIEKYPNHTYVRKARERIREIENIINSRHYQQKKAMEVGARNDQ